MRLNSNSNWTHCRRPCADGRASVSTWRRELATSAVRSRATCTPLSWDNICQSPGLCPLYPLYTSTRSKGLRQTAWAVLTVYSLCLEKKLDSETLRQLREILTDSQTIFAIISRMKIEAKCVDKFSPCLKYIAAIPVKKTVQKLTYTAE